MAGFRLEYPAPVFFWRFPTQLPHFPASLSACCLKADDNRTSDSRILLIDLPSGTPWTADRLRRSRLRSRHLTQRNLPRHCQPGQRIPNLGIDGGELVLESLRSDSVKPR